MGEGIAIYLNGYILDRGPIGFGIQFAFPELKPGDPLGQCPAKVPSLFRIDSGRGYLLDEDDVRVHLFAYQELIPMVSELSASIRGSRAKPSGPVFHT